MTEASFEPTPAEPMIGQRPEMARVDQAQQRARDVVHAALWNASFAARALNGRPLVTPDDVAAIRAVATKMEAGFEA